MNLLQQLDAIFTVQAGLVFAVAMICLLCLHSAYVGYITNKAQVTLMLEEAHAMNDRFDQDKWMHEFIEDTVNDHIEEDHYDLHARPEHVVTVPTVAYYNWLKAVKELGGYFDQPDEGDCFYVECWSVGYTPQQVTDYLNQPF